MKRKSFSLIELVITIIVVGIIAAIGASSYRKVVAKAKLGKAKHAVSLIAAAEKEYHTSNGAYRQVSAGAIDSTIGTNVTGMNLLAVDNDTDFSYSVTSSGIIRARNRSVIGSCSAGTTIGFSLDSGNWSIPSCFTR